MISPRKVRSHKRRSSGTPGLDRSFPSWLISDGIGNTRTVPDRPELDRRILAPERWAALGLFFSSLWISAEFSNGTGTEG